LGFVFAVASPSTTTHDKQKKRPQRPQGDYDMPPLADSDTEKKTAPTKYDNNLRIRNWKIRPTITDKRIARNLLRGQPDYKAVMNAGYAESTARANATEIINRPGVQTALAQALEAATMKAKNKPLKEAVSETMVAGLDATKVTKQGVTVTDFTERRRSAETVATFAGMRPASQLDVAPGESYHDRILRLNASMGRVGMVIDSYADEDAEETDK
jgi:hypothetical protein